MGASCMTTYPCNCSILILQNDVTTEVYLYCEIVALHTFKKSCLLGFFYARKLKYWKKNLFNYQHWGKYSGSGWKVKGKIVFFSSCVA